MENNKTDKKLKLSRVTITASAVLVVILLLTQIVILAVVGTKGSEISEIRQEQQFIRLTNEKIRADINSQKTLSQVEEVQSTEGLSTKSVNRLYWTDSVTAQL